MVGESWDAFTTRVLIEKHINSIMCENPGGHGLPLPTPMPEPYLLIFLVLTYELQFVHP